MSKQRCVEENPRFRAAITDYGRDLAVWKATELPGDDRVVVLAAQDDRVGAVLFPAFEPISEDAPQFGSCSWSGSGPSRCA